NFISFKTVVATSSTEAEYVAAASCCAQVLWIQNQLLDYGLQALVDRKKVVITEAAIRDALRLDDADGVDCLPNEEIFAELARMGYEKPSTKITFYKAFFSSQWKFLFHIILQSMSAKRTSWNEFSLAMASAVICLSTGRKFNSSKYIFKSLVRNVDSSSKFYMYPRFIQLIIQNQLGDLSTHTTTIIWKFYRLSIRDSSRKTKNDSVKLEACAKQRLFGNPKSSHVQFVSFSPIRS
nr:hypothetical protein [Tanacetum cinerariifolium]